MHKKNYIAVMSIMIGMSMLLVVAMVVGIMRDLSTKNPEQCEPSNSFVHKYADGQARVKGCYVDDLECGRWEWRYKNGNVRMAGDFDCNTGKETGDWYYGYASGRPFMTGTWNDNAQQHGTWYMFDEAGSFIMETVWENGKVIERKYVHE